ncbi:penicillin-binding protein 2 [Pseudoxanthomonas gei]|uniref:Peptidoglycan D,D-transpeptidase MrdA n=1 Tax=Pseudoxanthomonas gei TaxID=1383030 RepID=A0ABX0AH15_9GAMM|nr:penicillin-binding protein 2 [Pseudoxanthomonas gei]NDK38544.1 penicillin-binding protein 2 [Pseudoxanthomonas gei]
MAASRRPLKNAHAEAEQFRRRALLGFAVVALSLCGLAGWYFKLQVIDHTKYATRSEANSIKLRPVVPARGSIFDRNGKLLAENVPAFRLDVLPDKAGESKALIAGLSGIFALTPEDIRHFEATRKSSRGFRPITLKLRVSDEEMARFAVDRWRFPGVELEPYLTRRYPYGDLFGHIIGYVGRIDEKDLEKMGEGNAALTHTGKGGLERYYEEILRGKIGYEKVETNVEGRALRSMGRVPAQAGADLRLSVDADLQYAMTQAFGELEGSAVALDPRSGEVLAMVSLPSYDPNLFVNGISHADFNALNNNPSRPQFNRLVLGGVAPGSTLKPLIALAGLDSGLRRPEDKTLSTGMFRLPGMKGRGWGDSHRGGHGWTDVRKSIADSVNTYYYRLALDLGVERFDSYLTRYGFGQPTGIDLIGEIGGILPSPAAKLKLNKERWYPGDLVNAAIGQGMWKVTPLQLARGTAALADGGMLRRPHLVAAKRHAYDAPWEPLPQPAPVRISDHPANVRVVQEGMEMTVNGPGGTARVMSIGAPYRMAGKTGTAQVVNRSATAVNPKSLPMHRRHRALFVGYAPAENPSIAVAVMVEGGGYGASTAAPIARKIFDAWLLEKSAAQPNPDVGDASTSTLIEVGVTPAVPTPAVPAPAPVTPPAPGALR